MESALKVSREEYLKRYLNENKSDEKIKKRKVKLKKLKKSGRMRIIDVDIGMKDIKESGGSNIIEDDDVDEAPVIADVLDERPEHIKIKEQYSAKLWRKLGEDDSTDLQENSMNKQESNLRHDSDSDQSPPRQMLPVKNKIDGVKTQATVTSVQKLKNSPQSRDTCEVLASNPHRTRLDSDSDFSPERENGVDKTNNAEAVDSDCDLSPKRRRSTIRQDSDSDLSPKRRSSTIRQDSDSDFSPRRKSCITKRVSDNDSRPPRARNKSPCVMSLGTGKAASKHESIVHSKDSKGTKYKKDDLQLKDSQSENEEGHHVEKIRLRGQKKEEDMKQRAEEEKKRAEMEAKYSEWGKGLQQQKDQKMRFESDTYEMTKPLARYKDDEDLEQILKERDREGDPMRDYMLKKKKKNKSEKEFPQYKGPPGPPNRFNIQPGYRWDGVDRSNGFEQKLFSKMNNTASNEIEAYLWTVQDM